MACRFLFQSKRQLSIVTNYLMVFIQKTQKKAMSVLLFPIPVNSCAWSTFTGWIFFSGFLFATVCISCAYNCDDLASNNSSLRSSHIWFSYIHNFIIILSRVYYEPIQRPAPSWVVSLIGRALPTGIAEVKGSNPVQAWIFFQAFFSQMHKLRIQLRWSSFK